MRRMVSLILTLIVLLSAMNMAGTVYAEDTETIISGDYEYSINEDGTITITDYLGKDFDVRIPEIIDGKEVTVIGDYLSEPTVKQRYVADTYKDCIKTIFIPKTVEEINNINVFSALPLLQRIEVDKSNKCFSSKKGVLFNKDVSELICYPSSRLGEEYRIPKTVKTIGNYAFYGSKYLSSVKIGKNVKSVGREAFTDCFYITQFYVPPTVEYIGYAAFGCIKAPHSDWVSEYKYDEELGGYDFILYKEICPMKGFVAYGKKGSEFEKYCKSRKRSVGVRSKEDSYMQSVEFKYPKFKKPKLSIKKYNNTFKYYVTYYSFKGLKYEIIIKKGNKKILHRKTLEKDDYNYLEKGKYSEYIFKKFKPGNYTVKIRALIPISGYTFKTPWAKKTVKF